MTLIVFMEPDEKEAFLASGTFCCAPEDNAVRVKAFCKTKGLPYPCPFVSIAVLNDDEEPCESHAQIYGFGATLAPPIYAILKTSDEVISAIALVGNDDLKQALDTMARRHRSRQPYDSILRNIKDLRNYSRHERLDIMLSLTRSRGSHGYTEARLNRPLSLGDVADWGICEGLGSESAQTSSGEDIAEYFS